MLAVAGTVRDVEDGFAYEFKWDGIRAIVGCEREVTTIWSRKGTEVTARYPELADLAAAAGCDVVLDGEIVAFDADARPSFARLQRRMNLADPGRIEAVARSVPVAYLAFDVLHLDGRSLLEQPYEERRDRLAALRLAGKRWQCPPHHAGDLAVVLAAVGRLGLEGVVAKRLGSTYQPGRRSPDWRKLSRFRRDEFVVGGYRLGQGGRAGRFASLLLGYYDRDGRLRFAGSVGSGFTDAALDAVKAVLDHSHRATSPFDDPVPHRDVAYVEPSLVAEVQYSQWTPDGILRQPSFKGLRPDKDAGEVVRDPPAATDA